MQAYRLTPGGGVDGITAVELPDPEPGRGEVLVRVRATSLNYRDLMLAGSTNETIIPFSDGAGEVGRGRRGRHALLRRRPRDRLLLPQLAGRAGDAGVDARGPRGRLDRRHAGRADRAARAAVVPTPAYMTDEEAATLPCAAVTAWCAMFEVAGLRPGQSVLLLGTGGVSIFGLQLAQIAGVRSIITSSSDEKLARAREHGADETINYREHDNWESNRPRPDRRPRRRPHARGRRRGHVRPSR